jgi:hypothetical protein
MLRVIVLLKDDIRRIKIIKLQGILKFILQNLKVKIPIHSTINLSSIANSFLGHAAPYYQRTSTKFDSSLYQFVTEPLS